MFVFTVLCNCCVYIRWVTPRYSNLSFCHADTYTSTFYNINYFSVIDYVGCIKDLEAGQLRLIGDPTKRYIEDPVRMLRAIRFASKFDLKMHSSAEEPIKENFKLNEYEIDILKKISEWTKCVDISSKTLAPHTIPFYLYQLLTLFHFYWNLGKDNKQYRFVPDQGKPNKSRLLLLQALSIVIRNSMSILGVSLPNRM